MAVYEKLNLSPGGTEGDGNPISITTTSGNGTNIHDTSNDETKQDEVWLWATNVHTSDVQVTLHVGYLNSGSAAVTERMIVTLPSKSGWTLLLQGIPLRSSGSTPRRVAAFAGTADVVNVVGYVNRIS
jgi:hypothetical protein|tara:strand:+ start:221 stop:604 length:384 start_codon:yes stop_codon:yes gene_type:complete